MNKDKVPVLHIAARNKHADVIPVLVQEGADINKKGPRYVLSNSSCKFMFMYTDILCSFSTLYCVGKVKLVAFQ